MDNRKSINKILLIFICTLFFTFFAKQSNSQPAIVPPDSLIYQLDSLRIRYGINKEIPADIELQALLSLAHYPELSATRIKFAYKSTFVSMKALPSPWFIFQSKKNRRYQIIMSDKTCGDKKLTERITSTALIGLLGHELGHITDYSQRSVFGIIGFSIGYIPHKNRSKIEKRTDRIAIQHGLGSNLLEFSEYIDTDTCRTERYIKYKARHYYSHEQLREIIETNEQP